MPSPAKPDLQKKLRDVPHQPGVYLHKDRLNRVIYVGKARDLRKRLANYLTPSRQRLAEHKTRALIQSIWDFEYHTVRNEPEALLLEGKLIKEYRPKYNISFRDDKRFLLVKVNLEEPWPKFTLTRLRKDDGARYFGPFAHSGALRQTISWINKEFGLRACRPMRPGETEYKHCSNDIIKNCSAPCIGKISREDYLLKIDQACDFLKGQSKGMLAIVEQEMQEAAAKLDFERAAELRDMIENLKKTLRPTRQFRKRGVPGKAIKPEEDVAELQEALGMLHAPRVMECFDISNISDNHIVASMVRFKDGVSDNANYRRYRINTVKGQNDFASMAEVVRRRYSRILLEAVEHVGDEAANATQESLVETMRRIEKEIPEGTHGPAPEKAGKKRRPFVRLPDLVIVDGGKGQLSSAVAELQRLGLHDLPIVGLAKEREEIFQPGESDPIVLPHETGALRLMQRIRDEAHRFANGYHQILMKRRVEESILDDCPGVSQNRKKALLLKFKSVARMRKASAEDFVEVSGISPALSEEIVHFLKTHGG